MLMLSGVAFGADPSPARAAGSEPLQHSAYVWQRAWTPAVQSAVFQHESNFHSLCALAAEVSFPNGRPTVSRVRLDFDCLRQPGFRVSLALRINAYPGPYATSNSVTTRLTTLAQEILKEARNAGVTPSELQIDFDCAETKLDGYAMWLREIKNRVAPVPVVFTALPSWLKHPEFARLAGVGSGFVLQVHSLERPRGPDTPFQLCDPAAARIAVAQAARVGVPFQVALPTYGYVLGFNPRGEFIGLSAERGRADWPPSTIRREVRSDPVAMAGLLSAWSTNRPANLRGIIWYRLPIEDDILNWRWRTLGAMVTGQPLRERARAVWRRVEPGLGEICLVNDGQLDLSSRPKITARWNGARLIGSDGLYGFVVSEESQTQLTWRCPLLDWRLNAGEQQVIGWMRLEQDCEVQVELDLSKR